MTATSSRLRLLPQLRGQILRRPEGSMYIGLPNFVTQRSVTLPRGRPRCTRRCRISTSTLKCLFPNTIVYLCIDCRHLKIALFATRCKVRESYPASLILTLHAMKCTCAGALELRLVSAVSATSLGQHSLTQTCLCADRGFCQA